MPDTLNVGYLTSLTETGGYLGQLDRQAVTIHRDELQKEFGITINLFFADTENDPTVAVESAKRLVTQRQVDVLAGCNLTLTQNPVGAWATRNKVLFMASAGHGDQTNNEACAKYMFRGPIPTTPSTRAAGEAFGALPPDKWYLMYGDYAWGKALRDTTINTLQSQGKEIVAQSGKPYGTKDFTDDLNEAAGTDAEGILIAHASEDMLRSFQQIYNKGMHETYTLATPYNEDSWIWGLDHEVAQHMGVAAQGWSPSFAIDEMGYESKAKQDQMQAWFDNMLQITGGTPAYIQYLGRETLDQLVHAVVRAGSTDAEVLRQTIEGHDFTDRALLPGKHRWRPFDHNAVKPFFISEALSADEMQDKPYQTRYRLREIVDSDRIEQLMPKSESKCQVGLDGWEEPLNE